MKLFRKKIPCDNCDLQFSSEEKLMQHQQIVHGKELPYDCKLCNQAFTNMQDMRTHLQKYHSYKKT
jgi:KRAB domain-containing zinc finger protein